MKGFRHSIMPLLGLLAGVLPAAALAAINAAEVDTLQFGILEKPTSGWETQGIDGATGAVFGTGHFVAGAQNRAQFSVTNTDVIGITVTIDITNVTTGSAALEFDSFTGKFGTTDISAFPAVGLGLNASQTKAFYLGARLRYNATIPEGPYTPSYDIEITIE